jgi:hypothetical protein
VADETIAQPRPCTRCSRDALLNVHGCCPDCIGDMGLHHPDQHGTWRTELAELVRSGEITGG